MAANPEEGLFEFRGFKGLRNTTPSRSFAPGDLEVALNVDVDDEENIRRRNGYSPPVVGGACHSLFSNSEECFVVVGGVLSQVLPNYTTFALRSGLATGRPLAYVSVDDRTFYSNGLVTGIVSGGMNRSWGITPPGLPAASVVGGSLRPGRYQFVQTYLRGDGQESGARPAGLIELSSFGGVSFTALPVSADPTVNRKALYLSGVDGEQLYRVAVLSNTTTAVTVADDRRATVVLSTQFLTPPPPGEHLGYYAGRVFSGMGNRLRWSEPYSLELFDLRKGLSVVGRITMVAPMSDGVWLGTDEQIIWLSGDEPEKFSFEVKATYGVIPGSLAYGDSELLGAENAMVVAFFATTQGLCVGGNGGIMINKTQERFQYPARPRGAGVVRRQRGTGQFVTVLQG
ncbi:MAG: hypothetical protein DDT20_00682 [Firmicutes bacterium]|nr:hypothetical protein [Bacillota bacterium]